MKLEQVQFTPAEVLAVRAMQVSTRVADLAATKAEEQGPKREMISSLIRGTSDFFATVDWPATVTQAAQKMDGDISSGAYWDARASALAQFVRPSMTTLVLLEPVTDDAQPDKAKWVDHDAVVARTARLAGWGTTMKETSELRRQLVKATRRLSGDALSPTFRLSLAAGAVALSVASGGIAPAVGAAIGGTMGLSGAAATSAGLALLGGGSLAAGGFGVAGGTLLVTGLAKAGYSGARFLAVELAKRSSRGVVQELVKLDYLCSHMPTLVPAVVSQLEELLIALKLESGKEATKSARAVEAEIRYLTDSRGQRLLRRGHKALPIPGLGRQIDRL